MAHPTEDLIAAYARSDGLGLANLVRTGEVSASELVEAAVTIIDRLNPQLNAVVHKLYDMARAAVPEVDRNAPFAGVPYLLKEIGDALAGSQAAALRVTRRAPSSGRRTALLQRGSLLAEAGKSITKLGQVVHCCICEDAVE